MENYILRDDETVLLRSRVALQNIGKKDIEVELLLTNLNFVFIKDKKNSKTNAEVEVYDIKSVKTYDSTYQIIRNNKKVQIYMIGVEKFIEFLSQKEAKEFTDIALKIASGYSKLVRGVKKAQKTVKETEEALNIDIKETTKKAVAFAGEVAIAMGEASKSPKIKLFGNIAKGIKTVNAKNKQPNEITHKENLQLTQSKEENEQN